ncbi:MAG: UvrB/UvrC motif-containing protein [Tepidisphaeraceae bacterium]
MSDALENDSTGPESEKDLGQILAGWAYEPGTINVRRITGLDGLPKLQMRLELGLLQMEVTGRPDGQRPHGFESLLEYHHHRLTEARQKSGGILEGFALSPDDCSQLREEAAMYYQRYLSLFVLGDFPAVVRDTSRNLRVLDLCGQYAVQEQDRILLEQYRPYIVMMRTRAAASILFKDQKLNEALATVREGLSQIRAFFDKFGQSEAFARSEEVKVLKRFAREIKRKLPVGVVERLERKLKKAVAAEEYELAAKLRDEIASLQAQNAR